MTTGKSAKHTNMSYMLMLLSTLVIIVVAVPFLIFTITKQQHDATIDWLNRHKFDTCAPTSKSLAAVENGQKSSWDRKDAWKPLDCDVFLKSVFGGRNGKNAVYIPKDPNGGVMHTRYTNTTNPFWISMHRYEVDPVRWDCIMKFDGLYYERVLTNVFEEILSAPNVPAHARVVDVGGNIGWFSLLSASMQCHVDVFEVLSINILRQCQSKLLNSWNLADHENGEDQINARTERKSSVSLRQIAVADYVAESMSLEVDEHNPGASKVKHNAETSKQRRLEELKHVRSDQNVKAFFNPTVPVTTLDTMAEELGWIGDKPMTRGKNTKKPYIAILKIDIEGGEVKAVRGAIKLMRSGLVHNILMEVTKPRESTGITSPAEKQEHMLKVQRMFMSIFNAGFRLHKWGAWMGPDRNPPPGYPKKLAGGEANAVELHRKQAVYILDNFYNEQRTQVNFWFKR